MNRDPQVHLTDEEFVAFVTGDLADDDSRGVDQHLTRCTHCTLRLESFFEAQEVFPNEQWEHRRGSFVTRSRQNIFPIKTPSLLERVAAQLQSLVLPQGDWTLSLAAAQADTGPRLEDGETEDGILRWRIIEDENQDLMVRFGSHQTELEGVAIRLTVGTLGKDIVLHKVATDQVGAEVLITQAERNELAIDALMQMELLLPDQVSIKEDNISRLTR